MGKGQSLQSVMLGKITSCKRMKPDYCLTLYTKFVSKCIKGLNVRPEKIKLLEENLGNKLSDIGIGNDFLHFIPKVKATKENTSKWDYIKLKASAQQKKTSTK